MFKGKKNISLVIIVLCLFSQITGAFANAPEQVNKPFTNLSLTHEGSPIKGRQFSLDYFLGESDSDYYFQSTWSTWYLPETPPPSDYTYDEEHYFVVSKNFNTVKRAHSLPSTLENAKNYRPLILGVQSKSFKPSIINHEVYDGNRRLLTLEKDYETGGSLVTFTSSHVQMFTTKQGKVYYLIALEDNIPALKGQSYALVEWKNGRAKKIEELLNVRKIQVRADGQLLILWQHLYQTDGFLDALALTSKDKLSPLGTAVDGYYKNQDIERTCIGIYKENAVFAIKKLKPKPSEKDKVFFVSVSPESSLKMQSEKYISNAPLSWEKFSITSDGRILSIEKEGWGLNELYKGKLKSLSLLPKVGPYYKASEFIPSTPITLQYSKQDHGTTLPSYIYNGRVCICLEDLQLLGFTMVWDNSTRTSTFKYTGQVSATYTQAHRFEKNNIYQSDVSAVIWLDKTTHFRTTVANADGFSLISINQLIYENFFTLKPSLE